MLKGVNRVTNDVETIQSDDGSIYIKGNASELSQSLTRANTTDAYSIGDVIGTASSATITFTGVSNTNGTHFIITGADLKIDVASIPSGMGAIRLHLYNAAPTAIVDNAAFNIPIADRTAYLGYIEFDTPEDMGDTLWSQKSNVNMKRKLASDSTTIYGMLEVRTAFTPTAQAVKNVKLHILGV